DRPLPLQVGDRIVLRAPGSRNVFAGLLVLDVDPPELSRRGDGARRGRELAERPATGDILAEVARRGAVERAVLTRFGLPVPSRSVPDTAVPPAGRVQPETAALPAEVEAVGGWLVHAPGRAAWGEAPKSLGTRERNARLKAAGGPVKALSEALRRVSSPLPETQNADSRPLLTEITARAGLGTADGMVRPPGHFAVLGAAEAGIAEL